MDNNQNSNPQPVQPEPVLPVGGQGSAVPSNPGSTPAVPGQPGVQPTPPVVPETTHSDPLSGISQRRRSLTRRAVLIATGAIILIVGVTSAAIALTSKSVSNSSNNPLDNYQTSQLPASSLNGLGSTASIQGQLVVNGQLQVNGAEILTPQSAPPANPVPGQIYMDQNGVIHSYSNGKFVAQVTTINNQPVQITQESIGVGSLQGQTGSLNLTAGSGIHINGLTVSNGGVVSLTGSGGAIVTHDSNGNYSVSTTITGAYVRTLGGSSGDITLGSGLEVNPQNSQQIVNTGVTSFGAATGDLTLGNGLVVAGQQVQNTGVLSISGLNGPIGLGTGLSISGTNLVNNGVTSLGTDGTLNVSAATGPVNLSLPQSIAATASPTFAGLTLSTNGLGIGSGGTGRHGDTTIPDGAILIGPSGGGSSYALKTIQGAGGITIDNTDPNVVTITASAANLTLQNVYDSSTGSTTPEILLNNGGDTAGVDIQNNNSTPITGSLFAIRDKAASGLGTALFSIDNTGVMLLQGGQSRDIMTADTSTASTASHSLAIFTGNATGSTSNSGSINIDTGTATGTAGNISVGGSNASAVSLGRAATTVTVQGTEVVNGTAAVRGSSLTLGTASSTSSSIVFNNSSNSNTLTLVGPTNVAGSSKSINLPDLAGTLALVQTIGSSSAQTGDFNIAGTGFFTTLQTSTVQSAAQSSLTLQSGTSTGVGQSSGNLTIATGNATSTAGSLTIDTGTGATKGNVTIGGANAGAITIGQTGGSAETLTLEGNSSSALMFTNANGKTVTVNLKSGVPTQSLVYQFDPTVATGGTYNICTDATVCAGYVALQNSTPGSQQTGNINVSGTIIAGLSFTGNLFQTSDSTSSSTSSLAIRSGNASVGSNLSSGNVSIDSGTKTGTGTAGNITIGTVNASAVTIGSSSNTTTIQGAAAVQGASLTLGKSGPSGVTGSVIFQDAADSHTITLQSPASNAANAVINIPSAAGTLAVSASGNIALSNAGNITFTGVLPIANGGTGIATVPSSNGQLLIGAAGGTYALGSVTSPGSTISVGYSSGNITLDTNVGCTACAKTDLSNLSATTAINSSLLPGTAGAINVGSAAKPFANLFIGGTANQAFDITGTVTEAATTRTLTLDDLTAASQHIVIAQSGTPSAQSGGINLTGNVTAANIVATGLFQGSVVTSGDGTNTNIIVRSGTNNGATSGSLTLQSGNTGTGGTSGNVILDAGTGTVAKGSVTIAGTNASSLVLGRAGLQDSLPGGLTTNGSAITTSGGNLTLGSGNFTNTGTINSQTISSASVFTGTVAIQGTNALTLGTASTNNGAIVFQNSSGANTVTLQASSTNPASNLTLTLPSALATGCLNITSGGQIGIQGCSSGLGGSGTQNTLALFGAGGTSVANSILTQPDSNTIKLVGNTASTLQVGDSSHAGNLLLEDGSGNTLSVTPSVSTSGLTLQLPSDNLVGAACLTFHKTGSIVSFADNGCSGVGGSGGGNTNTTGQVTNHVAIFTSTSDTITAGVTQDNGTSVGINTAPSGVTNQVLTVGSSNAFNVMDSGATTVASLTNNGAYTQTSGNFDASGSSGTFKTSTGAVTLNGNTTVAAGNTLTVSGLTLNTQATNSVGAALFNMTLAKNDANTRTFYSNLIQPTINAGVSNANTTFDVLNIDTVNTNTTGVATNLLRLGYGGTTELLVSSAGNETLTGNLQVQGLTTAGAVVTDSNGNITSVAALPVTSGGTGVTSFAQDGQLLIGDATLNSGNGGYDVATLTAGSGIQISNGHGSISISAPTAGTCPTNVCADVALDNLASVAINTSLLPGNTSIDLGSNSAPFRNLYLGGTATNNFEFTGTATGARVITLDNKTGTLALVQAAGGSSAQTGDLNVSNNLIAGNQVQAASAAITNAATAGSFVGTLHQSADTNSASTNSGAVTFRSGNASGTTSNSGNVSITSGTATGTSGNVSIDSGAGTSANGTVSIGGSNASTTTVGRTGGTLTLQGNGSTTLSATNATKTATLGFANIGNNVTYNLDSSTVAAGTYQICTSALNSCNTAGAGYVQLQNATPGTAQTGNLNVSGTGIFGTNVITPLIQTTDANASAALTIRSGNAQSGNSNSGNVSIDSGTKTGTGTAGTVSLGATNASAVTIGTSSNTTTIQGSAAVQGASLTLGKSGPSGTDGSLVFLNSGDSHKITFNLPGGSLSSDKTITIDNLSNCNSAACHMVLSQSGTPTQQTGGISVSGSVIAGGSLQGTGLAVSSTVTDSSTVASVVNTGSGYSGKLLDLQAGTSPASVFSVNYQGNVTAAGQLQIGNATNSIIPKSGQALVIGTTNVNENTTLQGASLNFKQNGNSGVTTYNFNTDAGNNTYTICTTAGNCLGSSGGGAVSASGTAAGFVPVFSSQFNVTDSNIRATSNAIGVNVAASSTDAATIQGSASNDFTTGALNITNSSASSLFFVRDDGNVGIGLYGETANTGPQQKLDVNGNTQVHRQGDANSGTQTKDSYNLMLQGAYWNGSASVPVAFSLLNHVTGNNTYTMEVQNNSGTNILGLTQSGQLGVGNASPQSALDVSGVVTYEATTGGNSPANTGQIWYDSTNHQLEVSQNGSTPVALISSTQNWQVGGQNAGTGLQVLGNTNASGGIAFQTGGTNQRAAIDSSGHFLIGVGSGSSLLNVGDGTGSAVSNFNGQSGLGSLSANLNNFTATNTCAGTCNATVNDIEMVLQGTANTGGSAITNGIDFHNTSVPAGNTINAINVGSGYSSIINSANVNVGDSLQASASSALVSLGSALSGANANGTYVGVNTATCSSSCPDFLQFQNGNASKFSVAANGSGNFAGPLTVNSNSVAGTGLTVTAGGETITAGGLTVTAGGITVNGGGETFANSTAGITLNNNSLTGTATNNAINLTGTPVASTSALEQLGSAYNANETTYLGINAANGFTGNLIDAKLNNTAAFSVTQTGLTSAVGGLNVGSGNPFQINSSGVVTTTAAINSTVNNGAFADTGTPASASSSMVQLGSLWTANGGANETTYLGINAANGFTGNLIDTRLNSGSSLFKVDQAGNGTFAGTLTVGTATNGVTLTAGTAPSNSNPLYHGTAQPTKTINLTAEYAGAVLDTGGASSDIGTMTAGFDSTAKMNYYDWTTSQSTSQTYDIVVQIPVPQDFSSWGTTSVQVCNSNNTATDIQATITDTGGTAQTTQNIGATSGGASPCVTYASKSLTMAGTYTPGQSFILRLHLSSPQNGDVRVGNIKLNYLSNF